MEREKIIKELEEIKQKLERNQEQVKRIKELIGWKLYDIWIKGSLLLQQAKDGKLVSDSEEIREIIEDCQDLTDWKNWDKEDQSKKYELEWKLEKLEGINYE